MTSVHDLDVARLRAALASADPELDPAELRVRLASDRAEPARAGGRWRGALQGAAGLLVGVLAVVGVLAGAAAFHEVRVHDGPDVGVPVAPVRQSTDEAPGAKSTAAGELLLRRVNLELGRTRLTATMTTQTADRRSRAGAGRSATVIHAPGERRVRAEQGVRTFLDLGQDARPILVDSSARRVWVAEPGNRTLAEMIGLSAIDPVTVLLGTDLAHTSVRSDGSGPGRTLLQTNRGGTHLDCVIDGTIDLPISCRTYADRTGDPATTAFTWRQLTPLQWKTLSFVDAPAGYSRTELPG